LTINDDRVREEQSDLEEEQPELIVDVIDVHADNRTEPEDPGFFQESLKLTFWEMFWSLVPVSPLKSLLLYDNGSS
jgi:hypothetical protein